MLAGTDDHLTWLSPPILNLEGTGLSHLESENTNGLKGNHTLSQKIENARPLVALSMSNDPRVFLCR